MTITKLDALICLAAGFSQKQLIKKAQSLGLKVVAIDKDPHAICAEISDEFICESTYDAVSIIDKLENLSHLYNWKGILNRSAGLPVITASKIAFHFNLDGVPIETANAIVNKDILRGKCLEFGIPSPRYHAIDNLSELNRELVHFPIVMKPGLSLVGKSGITVLNKIDQVESAFEYAKDNSINGKVIIEDYLSGSDFTLISFVSKGRLFPIIALDEINDESIDGKIKSCGYKTHDPGLGKDFKLQAQKISQELIEAFNIYSSPFMSCFRANEDGELKLIEIHLDLGGDLLIEQLFPNALNFDYSETAVKMATGQSHFNYDLTITPTAIFYDSGTKLLNRRGFKLITGRNNSELKNKIQDLEI